MSEVKPGYLVVKCGYKWIRALLNPAYPFAEDYGFEVAFRCPDILQIDTKLDQNIDYMALHSYLRHIDFSTDCLYHSRCRYYLGLGNNYGVDIFNVSQWR
ncbi:hypothetical protein ETB97_006699 [Aspergillus alliaceus]|uniref:Uncharacterized protein n=1 Tax=Petromyces alliaceus TaxID=209559 RepID=A0A8H5ZTZ5_PETAA|nr:hypothetical protein ETB97_006699 [Aspergillus burnettii]